jgi:hypothetical protein
MSDLRDTAITEKTDLMSPENQGDREVFKDSLDFTRLVIEYPVLWKTFIIERGKADNLKKLDVPSLLRLTENRKVGAYEVVREIQQGIINAYGMNDVVINRYNELVQRIDNVYGMKHGVNPPTVDEVFEKEEKQEFRVLLNDLIRRNTDFSKYDNMSY